MRSYICPSGSQILEHVDQYSSVICSSVDRVPPVLSQEWLASVYASTALQQHSAFVSHDTYASAPASWRQHPMNPSSYPTPVSSSSLVARSLKTTSSLAHHPYSQPTSRHATRDYAAHHRSPVPQHSVSASSSGSSLALRSSGSPPSLAFHPCPQPITYHAAVEHVIPQLYTSDYAYFEQFPPAQNCVPETQSGPTVPDANQPQQHAGPITMPVSPPSPPVPSQSASHSLPEQADIEYALDRYGNKPCFYQCRYDVHGSPCGKYIVGDRRRILRHLRNYHHLQAGTAVCLWQGCTHTRQMRQENLSRHVVGHLGVKWGCPHCRVRFSRDDALRRHIERVLPGVEVPEADVIPGRGACSINELAG